MRGRFAITTLSRTARGLGSWAAVLGAVWGLGCGSSAGEWCCDCTCCDQDSHHEREGQSWTDCSDPCTVFCERDLGCTEPVERADPCPVD